MYFVYILRTASNTLYIGVTQALHQRIDAHHSGRGADWTRVHPGAQVVYSESYPTLGLARKLENVTLYNIDDLEALARQGAQARERELATCHQIIEEHVAALIEKLNAEDERLSAEQRKNRWMPDPFATPSNLLPTAA